MEEVLNNKDNSDRIAYLINKYLEDGLSIQETLELDGWLSKSQENRRLFEDLTNPQHLRSHVKQFYRFDKEAAFNKFRYGTVRKGPSVSLNWMKLAAAFIPFVIWGSVIIYAEVIRQDNTAILTLQDGTTLLLADMKQGVIAEQDNIQIIKQSGGGVSYVSKNTREGNPNYNSIKTTKGRRQEVHLSDGSRVMLNAQTKISYPTTFLEPTRNVTLSVGEAYFQVAEPHKSPFFVDVEQKGIAVSGADFNVNAQDHEITIKSMTGDPVKLIITPGGIDFDLRPGQQIIYDSAARVIKIYNKEDIPGYIVNGADSKIEDPQVQQDKTRKAELSIVLGQFDFRRFFNLLLDAKLTIFLKHFSEQGQIEQNGNKVTITDPSIIE